MISPEKQVSLNHAAFKKHTAVFKHIAIGFVIAISLVGRLGAAQIVPLSYGYVNGLSPYGLQDSGGELTDGLYGDINPGINLATPDPSGWVEFGGAGEVQFNFGSVVTITNFVLSMARWEPAAIYLPDVLKVNGADYSGYAGTFNDQDRAFISVSDMWTGSDLTIYFSHSQYLFMDEISFYATPVPEPSTSALLAAGFVFVLIGCRARARQTPVTISQ